MKIPEGVTFHATNGIVYRPGDDVPPELEGLVPQHVKDMASAEASRASSPPPRTARAAKE